MGNILIMKKSEIQMSGRSEQLLHLFPEQMREMMKNVVNTSDILQEIRLRTGREILIRVSGQEWYLSENGEMSRNADSARIIQKKEIEELLSRACSHSVYAYEEELKRGYLTLPGGHRMGVVGEVTTDDSERIRSLRYVSSVNLRIAHQFMGAADGVMRFLYRNGCFLSTVILSPPGCGKTTLLRDIIRQVSDGNPYEAGMTVGVVDERSEIGGCWQGRIQNDLGRRTDLLDACPKAIGMRMLIRSMSPQVVAVDELGGEAEWEAVQKVRQSGCAVLATVHGELWGEQCRKSAAENGFERYIFLSGKKGSCEIEAVLDEYGKRVDEL